MRFARPALAALAFALAAPPAAFAADGIVLQWQDLVPAPDGTPPPGAPDGERAVSMPLGVVQHGEVVATAGDGADVVTAYNGKTVVLSGFTIPIDGSSEGITSFMLVPFVGACIHVPPPPPNQLVFVTTATPLEMDWVFSPYTLTGTLNAIRVDTDLAEVGYTMTLDTLEPWAAP